MLSRRFKARVNRSSKQVGIKEKFSIVKDKDIFEVSMIFCLDRFCKPTVPTMYTREGFTPLKLGSGTLENSHTGIYSLVGYTQLICVVQGKLQNFAWIDSKVDFYVPGALCNSEEVYAEKAGAVGIKGCHPFHQEQAVASDILNRLLTVLPSKDSFYRERLRNV
jgi:hypothetical protein